MAKMIESEKAKMRKISKRNLPTAAESGLARRTQYLVSGSALKGIAIGMKNSRLPHYLNVRLP
jgi:hypothetical protein